MTVEQALETLGLSSQQAPNELRRAYLRKVRAHPPERDPEGFRAVREAYELLKGAPLGLDLTELPARLEAVAAPSAVATSPSPPVSSSHDPAPLSQDAEGAAADGKLELPPSSLPEVDSLLEELHQAQGRDDPVAVSLAIRGLYARPLLEGGPLPYPSLTLATVLALLRRGREDEAKGLLQAFEAHPSTQGAGGSLGPEIAARWKLVREVLRVTLFDQFLARALARSLQSGSLFGASDSAQRAYEEHGKALERFMTEQAPTIWNELAPSLRDTSPSKAGAGWGSSNWPWGASLFILFQLMRCASSETSRPSYDVPPPVIEAPRLEATPLPKLPSLPPLSTADSRAADERQRSGSWLAVEFAAKMGDCQTAGEQWPLYQASLARGPVDPELEASRRRVMLHYCAELRDLVEP